MKNLILILLFSVALLVTGCAFTDRLLLSPKTTPDGQELYIERTTGEETTNVIGKDGKPNERAYNAAPSGAVTGASSLLGLAGPWGAVAGYGMGILATVYAALRSKSAINAAKARAAAIKAGMVLVNAVVADWKSGILDTDRDGVVSLAEIADYIKAKAIKSLTPEGIPAILKVISDAVMPEPVKAAELEKIAAEL